MHRSDRNESIQYCTDSASEIITSVEATLSLEPGALGYGIRSAATFTATIVLFIDMCHQDDPDRLSVAEDRLLRGLRLLE